jgi:predicted acetyltransferase
MHIRPYDPTKDKQAVYRIFREVGWAEPGKEPLFDLTLECGRALVAELEGAPECIVTTAPGSIRYLDDELPMVEVTAVATSRVARQQGLARRALAQALAADAAEGAALARVCVFDQGFYNQVGFGPGSYEHTFWFDPATLRVEVKPRVPRRLTADDAKLIHASRLARHRGHGGVIYPAVQLTEMETRWWSDKGFGLGYCDGPSGELTHHFWCSSGDSEHGPYGIAWVTFQTRDQFLELVALLKGLSDQVHLVRLREPAGIQLQDLLHRPFRHHGITEKSRYENRSNVYAFWQVRLLDLGKALAHTHLPWGEVRFNLHLTDPIAQYLPEDAPWRGIAGDYTITLGPSSHAESETDRSLPTLTATVNAFSRLWLGVGPATGLAMTDQLSGPDDLLAELGEVLRLPQPRPDWDF